MAPQVFVRRSAIVKKETIVGRQLEEERRVLEAQEMAASSAIESGLSFGPAGRDPRHATLADGLSQMEAPPPPPPPSQPTEQQLIDEANRRAEAVLRQAQMEAKRLVEESKVYCQQALQEAERMGLEQGRQRGYEEARRETIEHVLQARGMFVSSIDARERMLRSVQPEIARLALKVAERILSTELSTAPEVINGLIATALDRVKEREHIRLLVHSDDLATVRANREVFVKLLEGQKSFDIVSDARVDRGGCLIESNQGNVDARVQTQLGALRLAFEELERRDREEIERLAREASEQAMLELEQQAPLMGYVQPPPVAPDPMRGDMLEAPLQQGSEDFADPGAPS